MRLKFAALHAAWLRARRGKRPSGQWLAFESRWLPRLQDLHQELRAGCWQPRRTVSFVVRRPKTREIHAPHFADRVVHHWLVPQLEALYEPQFIHHSYANRLGKGSHAAVDQVQAWMRQRNGRGWLLQLDVHNFFNSIHRPTLYALLKQRLAKAPRQGLLRPAHALALQSLCHRLLARRPDEHCIDPRAAAAVPRHKRLCFAEPGCGLAIGNLSSQFFANVYLNELDQFIKHELKAHHYARYVDDMVLLADDADTLRRWHLQIQAFLSERLRLKLKDAHRLAPLSAGVDFLGYVVFPQHRLVRRRVLAHCEQQLRGWARSHVVRHDGQPQAWSIRADPAALGRLQQMLSSYWGHFAHANTWRLRHALWQRHGWLGVLFCMDAQGSLHERWVLQGSTFAQQVSSLRQQWPQARTVVHKGAERLHFPPSAAADGSRVHAVQTGWLRHGTRRREIVQWHRVPAVPDAPATIP